MDFSKSTTREIVNYLNDNNFKKWIKEAVDGEYDYDNYTWSTTGTEFSIKYRYINNQRTLNVILKRYPYTHYQRSADVVERRLLWADPKFTKKLLKLVSKACEWRRYGEKYRAEVLVKEQARLNKVREDERNGINKLIAKFGSDVTGPFYDVSDNDWCSYKEVYYKLGDIRLFVDTNYELIRFDCVDNMEQMLQKLSAQIFKIQVVGLKVAILRVSSGRK